MLVFDIYFYILNNDLFLCNSGCFYSDLDKVVNSFCYSS